MYKFVDDCWDTFIHSIATRYFTPCAVRITGIALNEQLVIFVPFDNVTFKKAFNCFFVLQNG